MIECVEFTIDLEDAEDVLMPDGEQFDPCPRCLNHYIKVINVCVVCGFERGVESE